MDFVVIAEHPPDLCPVSNKSIRKQMQEGIAHFPDLAKKLGVEITFMGVPMIDHMMFFVVKAKSFEAVRNFMVESGLIQTQKAHIYPTVSMDEAMKMSEKLSPIF